MSSIQPDAFVNPADRSGHIVVALKWVDLRPEIDPLTGVVSNRGRSFGFSPADEAAVELALRLAESWGTSVVAICASVEDPTVGLRGLVARGVSDAVWVRSASALDSVEVAEEIAEYAFGSRLVVCGDYSMDRGSGSVPSFVAWRLERPASCGLRSVSADADGRLLATRRLDGGRREDLLIACPAVISIEAGLAPLRRAPLAASVAVTTASLTLVSAKDRRSTIGGAGGMAASAKPMPYRPAARSVPSPIGASALDRVVSITGALDAIEPPRSVTAEPEDAARMIVEQLTAWGYLSPVNG